MLKKFVIAVMAILGTYLVAAYLIAPFFWYEFEEHTSNFFDHTRITQTADGHPGDPLNVALIGTEAQLNEIMKAAGWYASDPLGLKDDLEIAVDTSVDRPYAGAPVSRLFLFGRKEDFAFEVPAGDNPRERNHVRFWRTDELSESGHPVWIGAASYDVGVGLSHTTGQVTHHIAADVDSERNKLFKDLQATGALSGIHKVVGFHAVLEGRNGGGDSWHTDGDLWVGIIAAN